MLKVADLHQYQKSFINYIINHEATFGILDMGLGKTVSVLTAIKYLQKNRGYKSALVIAPLRVCHTVWPEEPREWEHTYDMTVQVVHGAGKKKALTVDADIYAANYESIKFVIDSGLYKKCDVLVLDESSFVKSHKTQRFKLLKKIRDSFRKIVLLTGTPSGSGKLTELFSQTYMLDGGERFGGSYWDYQHRYYTQLDFHGYIWGLRPDARQKIVNKLSDITIAYKASDHLELPPLIYNTVLVPLPAGVERMYREIEKEFLLELGESTVIALNAAVLSGKLRQICAGGLYLPDGGWERLHETKIKALEEIVESTDEPVLLFYWFKFEQELVRKAFKGCAVFLGEHGASGAAGVVRDWNAGKVKLLCCHPGSAGHGLNLQKGSGSVVWLSLTWSLEQYQQAIARVYRQGQRRTCIVHNIVCRDTVDEAVLGALKDKNAGQQAMVSALLEYGRMRR